MTSDAEVEMAWQVRVAGLPDPVHELRFAPPRRWRFDLSWPAKKVALEVEGGTWIAGRHSRGAGFEADLEKYNAAALAGWSVYRVTPAMVTDGRALSVVEQALKGLPTT